MKSEIYPLTLSEDLADEIGRTAKATGLSKAEAMRQGLKFGLPKLREHLGVGRVTNVEPWPAKVARRLYRQRDDDSESIARFMAAQSKRVEE